MNLQPSSSLLRPSRPAPDNGRFDLLDVNALQDPGSGRIVHLYSLVARCLSCELVFKAQEGDGLVSTSAARVLRCPTGCGQQAFKPALLRTWRPEAVAQA